MRGPGAHVYEDLPTTTSWIQKIAKTKSGDRACGWERGQGPHFVVLAGEGKGFEDLVRRSRPALGGARLIPLANAGAAISKGCGFL